MSSQPVQFPALAPTPNQRQAVSSLAERVVTAILHGRQNHVEPRSRNTSSSILNLREASLLRRFGLYPVAAEASRALSPVRNHRQPCQQERICKWSEQRTRKPELAERERQRLHRARMRAIHTRNAKLSSTTWKKQQEQRRPRNQHAMP